MARAYRNRWHLKYLSIIGACALSSASAAQSDHQHSDEMQAPSAIASSANILFSNAHDRWKSTDIQVTSGDEITIFGEGLVNMGLPNALEPKQYLWARLGSEGPVFNLAANAFTFRAKHSGDLQLAVRPMGVYWEDRHGTFPADFHGVPPYPLKASAQVILWQGEATDGLRAMQASDPDKYGGALKAIEQDRTLPEGFEYLWYLSQSNVFSGFDQADRSGIIAHSTNDAGIVKRPLDIPLTPSTRLDFEWLYSDVRALGPESEAQFHDYMSIAIEFDNGQDITWLWSNHLDLGSSFTCPLPWWDQRETHIVLQAGQTGLGEWHRHNRPIAEDYASAVGGEMPKRITGIWFINSGVFGSPKGEARFANAKIVDGKIITPIFPKH